MQNESNLCKLEDYEKKIAFLHAKISKYKEKISIEKNKALNFEINHSKQIIELDSLRQEKLENETKIQKLECDLEDKNSQLEKIQLENHLKELQNNENHSLGNELSDMINNMETHHNLMKIERKGSISDRNETFNVQKELNEEQLELLEKENSLLIEKLKELQQTNEKMRLENLKNNALQQNSINTLLKEKEEMKEEINKLKIIAPSLANKELVAENKFLKEELEIYRTVIFYESFFFNEIWVGRALRIVHRLKLIWVRSKKKN